MHKVAVIGAGGMARVRAKALLSNPDVRICGVAARRLASARKFGAEMGCEQCFDDFRKLIDTAPDSLLVEVPHGVQDEMVRWGLERGLNVLIGGCLASSAAAAEAIRQVAGRKGLVVEAGYQDRYDQLWEDARAMITSGGLGRVVMARTLALWNGDPRTWYYQQQASGGMPLTHMTYGFINAMRWIFGEPVLVSAFANRIKHTAPGLVQEETCVANLFFKAEIVCNLAASFIKPDCIPGWSVFFLGTEAALELLPGEKTMIVYRGNHREAKDYRAARDPFAVQAEIFSRAQVGRNACRNTPEATVGDVRVAEAIVESARKKICIAL